MDLIVDLIPKENWAEFSENAHLICFGKHKPKEWDRIDYALIVAKKEGMPLGYVTVREMDSETAYFQFGGAFPSCKGSVMAFRGYQAFIEWARPRYKRITTCIENTNKPMLKFAIQVGFLIVGVRNFKGSILTEQLLEF